MCLKKKLAWACRNGSIDTLYSLKSPPLVILKRKNYDPAIYYKAENVEPFHRHVCIYSFI